MPNYIALKTGKTIKKYNVGKALLPMTIIRKHLYRTDLKNFHEIIGTADNIMFTDLESTQYYGDGLDYVDPDDTIAMLDTAPTSNNNSVGIISMFVGNPMVFVYAAIAIVILVTVVGGFFK